MIWADPQALIGYNIELYPHHNMVDEDCWYKESVTKIAGKREDCWHKYSVGRYSIHEDWPW